MDHYRRGFALCLEGTARNLALHHGLASKSRHTLMMAQFAFTCPATSMSVQHWLDDNDEGSENRYDSITCPACTRLHFLNRKTGKLLGIGEK